MFYYPVFGPFGFIAPITLNHLAFQSFDFECITNTNVLVLQLYYGILLL